MTTMSCTTSATRARTPTTAPPPPWPASARTVPAQRSELMARWIQAAAYTPFFRGHAHHDAKRREPWSFGQPTTSYIRRAIADRYALLPYWYSVLRNRDSLVCP